MTTYEEVKVMVDGTDSCQFQNADGEIVLAEIEHHPTEGKIYKLVTVQNNDWIRINRYYADGTIEETFDRQE